MLFYSECIVIYSIVVKDYQIQKIEFYDDIL